jgi:CRISPR type III-A-associated RAMP protein Csm4
MQFTTPLHLSRGQTDSYDRSEEILHSDSLKSAIFVAALMLFGNELDTNEKKEAFFDSFKVSSAFPFSNNDYFFPKPMAKLELKFPNIPDTDIARLSKKLKKLEFISKPVFEQIISGKKNITIKDEQLDKKGKFLFSEEIQGDKLKRVYKSEVQQRLAKAKEDGEDGTPYYIDRIYFTGKSGLYFFIDYGTADKSKVDAAVKLLGDEGVGTDKHVGNGLFEPKCKTLDLNLPENANFKMLLSLYCPEKEELTQGEQNFLQESSYQLLKRGGYMASAANLDHITLRKKSVYMFQEASVFPAEMKLRGKKEDLKPDYPVEHPVWRDGYALSVPFVKIQEDS